MHRRDASAIGLAELVDRICGRELVGFADVPYIGHLSDAALPLSEAYYIRHRIETVHRIRMTARLDALALASMVVENYECARQWSTYLTEELAHDELFLQDLAAIGIDAEHALRTPPLTATRAMVDELVGAVERVGAIAAVAYSLFVEWNSERGSAAVVDRVEAHYGAHAVAGARRHLGIDSNADHYALMVRIAANLLAGRSSELLEELLERVGAHLRSYYEELYRVTVRETAA